MIFGSLYILYTKTLFFGIFQYATREFLRHDIFYHDGHHRSYQLNAFNSIFQITSDTFRGAYQLPFLLSICSSGSRLVGYVISSSSSSMTCAIRQGGVDDGVHSSFLSRRSHVFTRRPEIGHTLQVLHFLSSC